MSEVGRREIVFLYDTVYSNPNGDPNDENKPRLDDESGHIFVTDVRLKRTIRDYLKDVMGKEVYIYEEADEKTGLRVSKKNRLKNDFANDPFEALKRCIDLRLFGATFAIKKEEKKNKRTSSKKEKDATPEVSEEPAEDSEEQDNNCDLKALGPVQFRFGKSLHAVKLQYIKGTTVMPGGEGKKVGTFTDKWVVPYALIAFYGMVNGLAAERQKLALAPEDLDDMYKAMWYGTKDLFTTSKSQSPMLLVEVKYNQDDYFIGDLDRMLSLKADVNDESIRDTKDYVLDVTEFVNALSEHADKIQSIRVQQNPLFRTVYAGEEKPLKEILEQLGFVVESFSFES